jgi:hypothetical protein
MLVAKARSIRLPDHIEAPGPGDPLGLDQHNTTGLPAIGRSRTATRRRPCPTAHVPHSRQAARSAVVSTHSHHSPSINSCTPTVKPGMPNRAVASSLR